MCDKLLHFSRRVSLFEKLILAQEKKSVLLNVPLKGN